MFRMETFIVLVLFHLITICQSVPDFLEEDRSFDIDDPIEPSNTALDYDEYAEDEVSFRITGHYLKSGSPTGELGTLRSGNTRRKGKCKWMRTLSGFKCIKTHRRINGFAIGTAFAAVTPLQQNQNHNKSRKCLKWTKEPITNRVKCIKLYVHRPR